MLRVSSTTLEGFRLMKTAAWSHEADFIEQVRGAFVPRWQMNAGSAFHAIIEEPTRHQRPGWDRYASRGYEFRGEDVRKALDGLDLSGVCECKEVLPVVVGGRTVELVAKCDRIRGAEVVEMKAKFSSFDLGFYEASLQWRLYLMVFGAVRVTYHVFLFGDPEPIDGGNQLAELKSVERFSFWPYAGMEADCQRWLGEFVEWAEDRGLTQFLRPRAA